MTHIVRFGLTLCGLSPQAIDDEVVSVRKAAEADCSECQENLKLLGEWEGDPNPQQFQLFGQTH